MQIDVYQKKKKNHKSHSFELPKTRRLSSLDSGLGTDLVFSRLEVHIFYKLRLKEIQKAMKLHPLTHLGFIHFGMAFGLLKFHLRSKLLSGKHVMIVYQLVLSCMKGRSWILSLVFFVIRKLKAVIIFFWNAPLLKPFGCNLLCWMITGPIRRWNSLMQWMLPLRIYLHQSLTLSV